MYVRERVRVSVCVCVQVYLVLKVIHPHRRSWRCHLSPAAAAENWLFSLTGLLETPALFLPRENLGEVT